MPMSRITDFSWLVTNNLIWLLFTKEPLFPPDYLSASKRESYHGMHAQNKGDSAMGSCLTAVRTRAWLF